MIKYLGFNTDQKVHKYTFEFNLSSRIEEFESDLEEIGLDMKTIIISELLKEIEIKKYKLTDFL